MLLAGRRPHLPKTPPPWQPTHRLCWAPRRGRAREWLVRVETRRTSAGHKVVATTLIESLLDVRPDWTLDDGGVWRWNGGGWNGVDGVAVAVPLTRR